MSKALSRPMIIFWIVVCIAAGALAFFLLTGGFAQVTPAQGPAPAQLPPRPPPSEASGKLRVSTYSATIEEVFLLADAGKDRGIWASNNLDPDFSSIPGISITAPRFGEQIALGRNIGISVASEVLLARSQGQPVKVIAGYTGGITTKVLVKADSPIKTVKDLDGKKAGVFSIPGAVQRNVLYLAAKSGIKLEPVAIGNLTNQIVALKAGRIDAFLSSDPSVLKLIDSGDLRTLVDMKDVLPKPYTVYAVFATDALIQQNPDLVKRFVKATLETVQYLKENPSYAADFYVKKTGSPKDLADKVVSQIQWTPSGRGSGEDLASALRNVWQFQKDVGAVVPPSNPDLKIEEAVDTRFLP